MEESDTSEIKQHRPWLFQPGVSGNPKGRPKGVKTLKTYVSQMLRDMSDKEKLEFLKGLPKDKIWEMGEGKAKQDTEIRGSLTISQVLDALENGQEIK